MTYDDLRAQIQALPPTTFFTPRGLATLFRQPLPRVDAAVAEAVAQGILAEDALWLCPRCSHVLAAQAEPPRALPVCEFCDAALAGWTDADWMTVRRPRYRLA